MSCRRITPRPEKCERAAACSESALWREFEKRMKKHTIDFCRMLCYYICMKKSAEVCLWTKRHEVICYTEQRTAVRNPRTAFCSVNGVRGSDCSTCLEQDVPCEQGVPCGNPLHAADSGGSGWLAHSFVRKDLSGGAKATPRARRRSGRTPKSWCLQGWRPGGRLPSK